MKDIRFVATDHRVSGSLERYFEQNGFKLKPFQIPSENAEVFSKIDEVLLLVCPIYCCGVYLSVEAIWKRHLQLFSPETLLLIAGFKGDRHSNYLDLFNLPADLNDFLKNTRTAKEKWEPVFSGGLDMKEKLKRFFQGHGDESVTDILHKILRVLNIAQKEMDNYHTSYEELKTELIHPSRLSEKWLELKNRWVNYYPFFEFLPFRQVFYSVDHLFKVVTPYFTSNCEEEYLFRELKCKENLKIIKDQLAHIGNHYVN